MTDHVIDREVARKVVEVVDQGLCSGVGKPVPGQMCVEAAVCYAQGLPHGDSPSCVGEAVRRFKISLNDKGWSSNAARAKGLRRVAVAQLGSDQIDQREFAKEVALQVTKQLLPIALRAVAKLNPAHEGSLEASALACEALTAFDGVRKVAQAAQSVATAARGYALAADAAASAAYADAATRDGVLSKAAEIGVQALKKLGSKGVEWLDLCDE